MLRQIGSQNVDLRILLSDICLVALSDFIVWLCCLVVLSGRVVGLRGRLALTACAVGLRCLGLRHIVGCRVDVLRCRLQTEFPP